MHMSFLSYRYLSMVVVSQSTYVNRAIQIQLHVFSTYMVVLL